MTDGWFILVDRLDRCVNRISDAVLTKNQRRLDIERDRYHSLIAQMRRVAPTVDAAIRLNCLKRFKCFPYTTYDYVGSWWCERVTGHVIEEVRNEEDEKTLHKKYASIELIEVLLYKNKGLISNEQQHRLS